MGKEIAHRQIIKTKVNHVALPTGVQEANKGVVSGLPEDMSPDAYRNADGKFEAYYVLRIQGSAVTIVADGEVPIVYRSLENAQKAIEANKRAECGYLVLELAHVVPAQVSKAIDGISLGEPGDKPRDSRSENS